MLQVNFLSLQPEGPSYDVNTSAFDDALSKKCGTPAFTSTTQNRFHHGAILEGAMGKDYEGAHVSDFDPNKIKAGKATAGFDQKVKKETDMQKKYNIILFLVKSLRMD
jgi:hypothetical protein